jgi:hypothetical protein
VERLATISVNLAALEHEEEGLIERSEEDGPVIARRSDASPMAILGLVAAAAESVAA